MLLHPIFKKFLTERPGVARGKKMCTLNFIFAVDMRQPLDHGNLQHLGKQIQVGNLIHNDTLNPYI